MVSAVPNSEQLWFPAKNEANDNFWVDGGDELQVTHFTKVLLMVDSWPLAQAKSFFKDVGTGAFPMPQWSHIHAHMDSTNWI